MHQDQRIMDLASLGIQGCRDSDQALCGATSLEFRILGYGVGDRQDRSQDYEDALDIHAYESFGCN